MRILVTVFALLLCCGFAVLALPSFELARKAQLSSDLQAFAARVEADPTARRALQYGGERPNENFSAFIQRVSASPIPSEGDALGKIIIFLSALGLIVCFCKRKKL